MRKAGSIFYLVILLFFGAVLGRLSHAQGDSPIDIGTRLELFVDDFLTERMDGTTLRLHHPVPRETAIVFDRPWEGNTSAYITVFRDGDIFRMYYRGSHWDAESDAYSDQVVCFAESGNAVFWRKPELGLYPYEGSKKNNIVWRGLGAPNFTPFKDANS